MQVLSNTRLERIIRDFNLYERERRVTEDAITRMRRDIALNIVASGEKGAWFTVAYHAGDPKTAMRVAERLASLFVQENLEPLSNRSARPTWRCSHGSRKRASAWPPSRPSSTRRGVAPRALGRSLSWTSSTR